MGLEVQGCDFKNGFTRKYAEQQKPVVSEQDAFAEEGPKRRGLLS